MLQYMYVHVEMQVQYAFVFFELNDHEQVCIVNNVCSNKVNPTKTWKKIHETSG